MENAMEIEQVEQVMQPQVKQTAHVTVTRKESAFNAWLESMKFHHFFVMSFSILVGSCLGSIAAMAVFYNNGPLWAFAIGLFASIANLVACIAQAPTKWVIFMLSLSVVVNTILVSVFAIF